MNVLIPYSWVRDYIKTNANAEEAAKALSLHSFNVERINKVDGDDIFEVEVTPNRGDALSVLGVARELNVVLPKMGFKSEWINKEPKIIKSDVAKDKLEVVIKDKTLVPRFSAIVLDNVKVGKSPKKIEERLESVGIRALGNVIDVTNYLMIDKGQPMHSFDYDKIRKHKMIVRESQSGEVVVTLDGVERKLPAGVIVIEDGDGRLIDLCGIMGAKNSEVDENTKKVLLFVQVYDPVRIRKASMSLGHRTEAALRFEKGIDYDGVIPALWESVDMINELVGANVSSELIDIKNMEREQKSIQINYEKINKIAGVDISIEDVDRTLKDLGFKIMEGKAVVPSWRYEDMNIIEDLAEEVIRIYGYYNLPCNLPAGHIPVVEKNESFYWEDVAKDFLKHLGFFECYSYSATKKENVSEDALKIANPLSEDLLYLRTSLLPQLLEVLDKNQSYGEKIKLFELASIYTPYGKQLPYQPVMLGMVTKGFDEMEVKGLIEALFDEIGVDDVANYDIKDFGNERFGIELNFMMLSEKATRNKTYTPLTGFNSIKEDLTFVIPKGILYGQVERTIFESDERIKKLEFKDVYKNALTFSIEYLDRNKQISSEETQEIRKKIFGRLEKIGVSLKV